MNFEKAAQLAEATGEAQRFTCETELCRHSWAETCPTCGHVNSWCECGAYDYICKCER